MKTLPKESFDNYINSIEFLLKVFRESKANGTECTLLKEDGTTLNIDEIISLYESYLIEALNLKLR